MHNGTVFDKMAQCFDFFFSSSHFSFINPWISDWQKQKTAHTHRGKKVIEEDGKKHFRFFVWKFSSVKRTETKPKWYSMSYSQFSLHEIVLGFQSAFCAYYFSLPFIVKIDKYFSGFFDFFFSVEFVQVEIDVWTNEQQSTTYGGTQVPDAQRKCMKCTQLIDNW